jgi:multimeric flavodoxin WrbA
MADVLAIQGSPRAGGNSDTLVDEAVKGAGEAGHRVTTLALREHEFSGCVSCGGCRRDGLCHVKDAMQNLFTLLERNEHVILGAPMFFMDVPWKVKAMIDRCQVYWARKFILKADSGRRHPGGNLLALLVGGTHFKTLFDAPRIVLRAWCATVDLKLHVGLALRGIDHKGDISRHPDALARARELGRTIAELARRPSGGLAPP